MKQKEKPQGRLSKEEYAALWDKDLGRMTEEEYMKLWEKENRRSK